MAGLDDQKLLPELKQTSPDDHQLIACWRVTSPYSFENISLSKAVQGMPLGFKYLSCAECDLGPLGWHDPSGTAKETETGPEYLLAVDRAVYDR